MPWTDTTTPLDGGTVFGGCWAPDLAEFVAAGADGGFSKALLRSPDGIVWTWESSPFDGGNAQGVVRASRLGLSVAVGFGGAGLGTAICTSPDDVTWTSRGNPFVGVGSAYGVAVRASDGALLVAGTDSGNNYTLAASLDDGATWALYGVLGGFGQGNDVAVRASDDTIIVGGGNGGINYVCVIPDLAVPAGWVRSTPLGAGGVVQGVAVRVSDGALVVAGGSSAGYAQIAVSTDDGATWTTYDPFGATPGSYLTDVAVRADDALLVTGQDATGANQFAISTDGGTSWAAHAPFGAGVAAIAYGVLSDDADATIIVVGNPADNSYQYAASTDSGATWATTKHPFGVSTANAVDLRAADGTLWVVGGNSGPDGVSWSLAAADAWTVIAPFGAVGSNDVVVRVADGAIVIAGGHNAGQQLAITKDSGATWSLSAPFGVTSAPGYSVACKQSTGVLVVGAANLFGAIRPIARSTDGITWQVPAAATPFDDGGGVLSIDYSPSQDRWIAAGRNDLGRACVAYSDDDGVTWTEITTHPMVIGGGPSTNFQPTVYRDEATASWFLMGATSGGHALAVSSDGGATWVEVGTPLDGGGALGMVNAGGAYALCGCDADEVNQVCTSGDGLTWFLDPTPSPFGTTPFNGQFGIGFAYSSTIGTAVVFGNGP